MSKTTRLYGKTFQQAHLALCEKRKQPKRKPLYSKREVIDAVAIAAGILIGITLLCLALNHGLARGNGWHVGNYRTTPCWND